MFVEKLVYLKNIRYICKTYSISVKIMVTRPYPQIEETPVEANEPAVAYQAGVTNRLSSHVPTPYEMEVLRRSEEDYKAGRVYSQEEVDKMLEQWLN